jgi:hypothetical protein
VGGGGGGGGGGGAGGGVVDVEARVEKDAIVARRN